MKSEPRIATLRAESDGQAIVEAALILPLLFFIIFGILWFGRVLNVYSTLYRAAHEAAEAYGSNTCGSCGNNTNYSTIATNVLDPIFYAAGINPAQVTFTPLVAQLNPSSSVVELGTTVSLTYKYPLKLYGITCCPLSLTTLMDGITITAHAQAREEN
jgi:Flp pilus assembly protein TadG